MPYISTEALVGAALLVVVALGYQYIPVGGSGGSSTTSKSSKKKNKKKSKGAGDAVGSNGSTGGNGHSSEKAGAANETDKSSTSNGPTATQVQAQQATKPKTLAQKIAPQPRKTKVDE